ncbi:DUF5818 domain-containing protein [Micromonospora sp. WMMD812]|uniref:DUF5818 domain-containing protein n=1 Tax=Micromonospora sp. WMMD812 TaxID=3015152 RepID=UPI00248CCFA5|nr:DUF5818 domain-containing protein [Micromonospora sp. WMMD812]WBB68610.1 DUF5818 domain-containing protein [Micromonospora sp. WMMD812]
MRRAGLLLTAVGLLCWVTACASPDRPEAVWTGPTASGGSTPSAGSDTPAGATPAPVPPTPRPSRSTPTPPPATARPEPTRPAATPPGGGDVPGPLPWGGRTLTGTVERDGGCTMLLVGERRWALTGDVAAGLTPGDRVTVHGGVAPRPAACGDRDLAQALAVNRVEPA